MPDPASRRGEVLEVSCQPSDQLLRLAVAVASCGCGWLWLWLAVAVAGCGCGWLWLSAAGGIPPAAQARCGGGRYQTSFCEWLRLVTANCGWMYSTW